jgi:hypothetical protein
MYGPNTRGFAVAVITGGLIGVSGTSAALRAGSPRRPEDVESHPLGIGHASYDSESAVERIALPQGAEAAGGRSMQVGFGQRAPRELGGQRPVGSGGPVGPPRSGLAGLGMQAGFSPAGSPRPDPRHSGFSPAGAPRSDPRQSGLSPAGPRQPYVAAAPMHRPGPAGPLGPGGAPLRPGGLGGGPMGPGGRVGAGQRDRSFDALAGPFEEYPARAEGCQDYGADLMGGPVLFPGPVAVGAESSAGLCVVPDRVGVDQAPAPAEPLESVSTRTGSHHVGIDGYRTVADLVASTGGYSPADGASGRRRQDRASGLRVVPDVPESADYVGVPEVPQSGGDLPAADLSGTGGHRPVSDAPRSGGRRRAVPESVGTDGHRAVPGAVGYRPVSDAYGTALAEPPTSDRMLGALGPAEGSLGTGFDTYGEAAPEVELGRMRLGRAESGSTRSGMFIDRAVESSLPTAAVVSQRFTSDGTGGYRAVEASGRHLAEPRRPTHDTPAHDRVAPGRQNKGSSALGSLDSSGLFGSLSPHQR